MVKSQPKNYITLSFQGSRVASRYIQSLSCVQKVECDGCLLIGGGKETVCSYITLCLSKEGRPKDLNTRSEVSNGKILHS
jgi:hypothetical protein